MTTTIIICPKPKELEVSFCGFFKIFFLMWIYYNIPVVMFCVFVCLFVFIWLWGMWDLNSPTGDRTCTPCIRRRNLNPWEDEILMPGKSPTRSWKKYNKGVKSRTSCFFGVEWSFPKKRDRDFWRGGGAGAWNKEGIWDQKGMERWALLKQTGPRANLEKLTFQACD